MAEARAARASLGSVEFEHLTEREVRKTFVKRGWKWLIKRIFKTRNQIRNGMWPTNVSNLKVSFFILSGVMVTEPRVLHPLTSRLWRIADMLRISEGGLEVPRYMRIIIVSGVSSFGFFLVLLYVRRYVLHRLLNYTGWLYDSPKSQSVTTTVWGALVRLTTGLAERTLYSSQLALPRLPVPPLKQTINLALTSMEPLHQDQPEKLEELRLEAEKFERSLGGRLQSVLTLKAWFTPNYVSDWWQNYVYLGNRQPLPNNSNYYVLTQMHWTPSDRQCSRAAQFITSLCRMKVLIDSEKLTPLVIRNTVPLCMRQYRRIFGTVRLPGIERDELKTTNSKYVVVSRYGHYYKLYTVTQSGRPLPIHVLEEQLEWILSDGGTEPSSTPQQHVAALTAMERGEWARQYEKLTQHPLNRETLSAISGAMFMVTLVDKAYDNLKDEANFLLHGDGSDFWFDKSLTMVAFANGRLGFHCEHSYADAPVLAHVIEFGLIREGCEKLFREDGQVFSTEATPQDVTPPLQLHWKVNAKTQEVITNALSEARTANDDIDLGILEHNTWGKGIMKRMRVSPDAFIQQCLMLTYYRLHKQLPLTYEAAMTRFFLNGRTETVRSMSSLAAVFCKSFDDTSVTNEERLVNFQAACDHHQKLYRDAMTGKGCDRHLFALYVCARGVFNQEPTFLKQVLSEPWILSTSQVPIQQMDSPIKTDSDYFKDKMPGGGGFGPVADAGYGVNYIFAGEELIVFNITSKISCADTSTASFITYLTKTMDDVLLMAGIIPPTEPTYLISKGKLTL